MELNQHKDTIHQPSRSVANSPVGDRSSMIQRSQLTPPQLFADEKKEDKEEVPDAIAIEKGQQQAEASGEIDPSGIQLKAQASSPDKEDKEETESEQMKGYDYDIPPVLPNSNKLPESNSNQALFGRKKASSDGLPDQVLQQMNGAFGQDFSNVKVHKNSSDANDMGALAFASGNNIHFAPGQYQPESKSGQELIGHELAHTVQQSEGRVKPTIQHKGKDINDDVGLEKEADEMGKKAVQFKLDDAISFNNSEVKSLKKNEADDFGVKFVNNQASQLKIDKSIGSTTNAFQLKESNSKEKGRPWWTPAPTSGSELASELNEFLETGVTDFLSSEKYSNTSKNGKSDLHIVSLLKTTSFKNIQTARMIIESSHKKKLEELLINKMGGSIYGESYVTTSLIEAVYLINNREKKAFHLDLAKLLLTRDVRKDEILRMLESFGTKRGLTERKKIKLAYNNTFLGNLSSRGLSTDLKRKLTHDAEKKALALFHHNLTPADQLLYHITGDKEPKAAASIFTSAMSNGFEGVQKLEDDWNAYVRKTIHGSDGPFFDAPLFLATKKALGKDSQAWKTIAPIETGYYKWKLNPLVKSVSKFVKGDSQNSDVQDKSELYSESELLVEMSLKIIEEASLGSKYGDKSNSGIDIYDEISDAYDKGQVKKNFKNFDDQIDWAISTFKTHMPIMINQSSGLSKKYLIGKSVYTKLKIENILDKSYDGKKSTKGKIDLNAPIQNKDSIADVFYSAVISKNKKQALKQAEDIWAKDQVHILHKGLTETERKDTMGNLLRPRLFLIEEFLKQHLGKKYTKRVFPLINIHNSPEGRGYSRLSYEIMHKKPDLQIITELVSNPYLQRTVLDRAISIFVQNHALQLPFIKATDRRAFLEIIRVRKFTKTVIKNYQHKSKVSKPNVEFMRLEKIIDFEVSNAEKIERDKAIAEKQGLSGNTVLGSFANTQVERMEQVAKSGVSETLSEQSGIADTNEFLDVQSEELNRTLDTIKKELEEEAAFAAFVVEMVAFGAIAILSGGSASGLLIAAIASKAAGMGAKESVLGDNYELLSGENLETLAITGLSEVATLGLGKAFKSLKVTSSFQKLKKMDGRYAKVIVHEVATQVTNQGIEASVKRKLPTLDEAVINLVLDSIGASFNLKLDTILNESRIIRNKVIELVILETPKEVSKAISKAALRGKDVDLKEIGKSLAMTANKQLSSSYAKSTKSKKEADNVDMDQSDSIKDAKKQNDGKVERERKAKSLIPSSNKEKGGKSHSKSNKDQTDHLSESLELKTSNKKNPKLHQEEKLRHDDDDEIEEYKFEPGDAMMAAPMNDDSPTEQLRYLKDSNDNFLALAHGKENDSSEDKNEFRSREVGMYRNDVTGEIVNIQGNEGSVPVRGKTGYEGLSGSQIQEWQELLDNKSSIGKWKLVRHSHPINPESGQTPSRYFFPSGKSGDFGIIRNTALGPNGKLVANSSIIDVITAEGPKTVSYGFNPANPKPYWIKLPSQIDGHPKFLSFKNLKEYHEWYQLHYHVDMDQSPSANGSPAAPDSLPKKNKSVEEDFPEVLQRGETVIFDDGATATKRKSDGVLVISSTVGPGKGRKGYEKGMFLGVEIGLEGWERAHTQGQGTGHENPYGILYAPSEVNQAYQNRGIEQEIRDLFDNLPDDNTIHLITETLPHENTQRLKEITYKIEITDKYGTRKTLFETSINVANKTKNPKISVSARKGEAYASLFSNLAYAEGTPRKPKEGHAKSELTKNNLHEKSPIAGTSFDKATEVIRKLGFIRNNAAAREYSKELQKLRKQLLTFPRSHNKIVSRINETIEDAAVHFPDLKEKPIQKKTKSTNIISHNSSSSMKACDSLPSGININKNSSQATEMGALAYTQGSDIHFAPGQFRPDTKSGQELIGHELHHVKQQKEGRVQATKREGGFKINDDQHLEKEADDAGKAYAQANKPAASTKQLKQEQSGSSSKTPGTAFELTPEIQMKAKNTSNTLAPHFSIQRAKPTQQNSEIQHPFKLEKV